MLQVILAMTEKPRFYPEIKKPGETQQGLEVIQEMVNIISQPNPSTLLTGLPTYHLKRISMSIDQEPEHILNQISVGKEAFIALCRVYDSDIVLHDSLALNNEEDSHRKVQITEAIARAIVRSDLNVQESVKNIDISDLRWKIRASTKVFEYNSGIKEFDGLKPGDIFTQKK